MLGNIVAGGLDLRETARPHLVALREATRETTQIAILDHWQVVYLERMLSSLSVGYMRSRAGAILPAYCTGLGKTLLAFRPEAEVAGVGRDAEVRGADAADDHVGEAPAERSGGRSASAATASTKKSARKASRCVAAPIFNHTGDVVAAISVAGPTERMPRELVGSDVAAAVVAAARAISIDLGAVEEWTCRCVPRRAGGAWRTKVKRVVVGLVVAAFLLPAVLAAQAVTGTIIGVITDTSGAVMPGATVTLTNTGNGLVADGRHRRER